MTFIEVLLASEVQSLVFLAQLFAWTVIVLIESAVVQLRGWEETLSFAVQWVVA